MSALSFLRFFLTLCLAGASHAQQSGAPPPLQIRAVLHDPVHPTAELYLANKVGGLEKLKLVAEGWSEAQVTVPFNGQLVLFNSATADLKKPGDHLAASCRVPANTKRAMVVVLPSPAGTQPAYRMVLVDDSPKAFPMGESRVLTLMPIDAALEIGEHKLPVQPGKITVVPPVKKRNEYNMAQTNFYYKDAGVWVAFTERQLRYLDAFRRVFIIHVTPGAIQPTVTTFLDIAPSMP